jgi:hypothetical protein
MKPKSIHKQVATHNRDTKQTTKHKKERPKTQPQDLSHSSKISHSISKRLVPGAGDCASLMCRFVTARLSVCPLWAPFRPSDDDGSRNPTSVGGQDGSRSEKSVSVMTFIAVETVTKRVKMVEKMIRRALVSSGTNSEKPIHIPR